MKITKHPKQIQLYLISVLFVLLMISNGFSQQEQEKVDIGFKTRIESNILKEEREIYISLPHSYGKADGKFPVFYILDADYNFQVTKGIINFLTLYDKIPEAILIGIPNKNSANRNRDLTPTKSVKYQDRFPTSGGADNFLTFITDELVPFVENNFKASDFRLIIGHSLGGLFVIHSLITDPNSFSAYFAFSPSLWWNEEEYYPLAEKFLKKQTSLKKYLYITRANAGEERLKALKRLKALFDERAPDEFTIELRHFGEEDHISTYVQSTLQALKYLFEELKLLK